MMRCAGDEVSFSPFVKQQTTPQAIRFSPHPRTLSSENHHPILISPVFRPRDYLNHIYLNPTHSP